MSDEIKEILESLAKKASIYKTQINRGTSFNNDEYEASLLLDYITNLQTIEREYSSLLSENAKLQQENENLKDFNNKLQATKDRLDKYDRENQLEIDRLNNIINELEKYIGQEWYCFDNESVEFKVAKDILDKLKELKENNNAKD